MKENKDIDTILYTSNKNPHFLEKELFDCKQRIASLRHELHRTEREANSVEYLVDIIKSDESYARKLVYIGRLAPGCIVPDFMKWLFRPFTRKIKRLFRYFESGFRSSPYRIRPVPAKCPQTRILHVIANFKVGGSSRLVVDLAERLGDLYEHHVLTGFIPSPLAYKGIPVYERRSSYEIAALIEKIDPEILHVHYWGHVDFAWYDKVFGTLSEKRIKIIQNINTPVMPYKSDRVYKYVYVSNYVKREFGSNNDQCQVIYPGSDLDFFSREDGCSPPENCVGMVYRLESDKLNLQSIDVFISVAKRSPETKVLIVGGGSLLDDFKSAVAAHSVEDSFVFTGSVSYKKLPSLFKEMSIFVAPVWKESFGQVSCFAMGVGIPVVGYKVGGIEEIVDNNKILAPPGDVEGLTEIIVQLLNDSNLRRTIGENNRTRARSLFSIEKMILDYEQLYEITCGEQK